MDSGNFHPPQDDNTRYTPNSGPSNPQQQGPYNQQPPYGYPPNVPITPQKPWYKRPKVIILVVFLILVTVGSIIKNASSSSSSTPNTTITPTTSNVSQNVATATPMPTLQPTPTPKPTQQLAPTATQSTSGFTATHGTPHIGGPMSDFVGKYGQPISQGSNNSENFYADSAQTIVVNVTPKGQNQEVTAMDIGGDSSWSDGQTKVFCTQFLPSDATEYNAVDNITDYHSSVGQIVLMTLGQGMCLLNIV